MRILKLAKYRLKAQVEKDEDPSGEGQSPQVEKDEGPSGTMMRIETIEDYGYGQLHPISVSPGLAYDNADYGYIYFLCHDGYK